MYLPVKQLPLASRAVLCRLTHHRRSIRWRSANTSLHILPPACKHAAPRCVNTGSLNWFRICSFQGTGAGSFSKALVGLSRLELPTSRLSGVRSNLLSYKPSFYICKILFYSGARLFSHAVSSIVPSAVRLFTVVFGMGTGVSSGRIGTRNS